MPTQLRGTLWPYRANGKGDTKPFTDDASPMINRSQVLRYDEQRGSTPRHFEMFKGRLHGFLDVDLRKLQDLGQTTEVRLGRRQLESFQDAFRTVDGVSNERKREETGLRCTLSGRFTSIQDLQKQFLAGTMKKRYKLGVLVKPKPVISADDLLVLLSYLWASDDFVMPDEEQRVQFATILLFAAFTGSRPAELVDASLSAKDKKKIKDAFWRKTTPWDNPDDSDYDGPEVNFLDRAKSLCWDDVELRIVALDDGRMVLAMWIAFTHHEGVDRKPLPYVSDISSKLLLY